MINNVTFTGMREKLAKKAYKNLTEVPVVRASSILNGTLNEAKATQAIDAATRKMEYLQANPIVAQYTSPFAPINVGAKLNRLV